VTICEEREVGVAGGLPSGPAPVRGHRKEDRRIGDGNVNCHWVLGEVFVYDDMGMESHRHEMGWKVLPYASRRASTLPRLGMTWGIIRLFNASQSPQRLV
jgi:hypothetical protein